MTTHKAHVNILHNQCLASQAVAIFMAIYAERVTRDASWDYCAAIAEWTYLRATRQVIPALFDGVPEDSYPCFETWQTTRSPKTFTYEDETL